MHRQHVYNLQNGLGDRLTDESHKEEREQGQGKTKSFTRVSHNCVCPAQTLRMIMLNTPLKIQAAKNDCSCTIRHPTPRVGLVYDTQNAPNIAMQIGTKEAITKCIFCLQDDKGLGVQQ